MNWVDVILALLFTAGLAGGYIQRLLRQALSLGALVCGIILATYLQVPLAAGIAYVRPEIRARTRETAAFWLLLVAITVALDVIQRRVLPETKLLAVGILDRIGGVFVAFFTVCGQMSVAVLILRFFVRLSWPIGNTLRLFVWEGMESSTLVTAFYNLLVSLVQIVGRFLPEGGPGFLAPI